MWPCLFGQIFRFDKWIVCRRGGQAGVASGRSHQSWAVPLQRPDDPLSRQFCWTSRRP